MGAPLNFDLPLSFQQLAEIVRQLPLPQKIQLVKLLQTEVNPSEEDSTQTHFASQVALAKDWLNQEEENAWQHL